MVLRVATWRRRSDAHLTPLIATRVCAFAIHYAAGMTALRLRLQPIVAHGPFTPGVVRLMFGIGRGHFGTARALLIAIPQALEAGQVIRAPEANPALAVPARAHADEEVSRLLRNGADAATMGEREIARSMCESVDSLARWFERRPHVVAEGGTRAA